MLGEGLSGKKELGGGRSESASVGEQRKGSVVEVQVACVNAWGRSHC